MSSFGEGWNLLLAAHGEGLSRTYTDLSTDPSYVRDFTGVRRLAPSADKLLKDPNAHARYLVRADAEQRRLALHLYRTRLAHDPGQVLWESVYRAYFLWMAHEDWYQPSSRPALDVLKAIDWLVLGLALVGSFLWFRAGGAARAIVVFLLVFTAINALHHVEARYAIPVRGLELALAVCGLLGVLSALPMTPERRSATQNATYAMLPAP
jgi:hypothetical protein